MVHVCSSDNHGNTCLHLTAFGQPTKKKTLTSYKAVGGEAVNGRQVVHGGEEADANQRHIENRVAALAEIGGGILVGDVSNQKVNDFKSF